MAKNIVVEIQNALAEYNQKVQRDVEAAAKEAAEVTAKQLKSSSPVKKGKGGGIYRRSWSVKKMESGINTSYVVYNSRRPGLTHLLERGHAVRNQYGSWGSVRGIKHIEPAAEAGMQRFDLSIRARLHRG